MMQEHEASFKLLKVTLPGPSVTRHKKGISALFCQLDITVNNG